MLEGHVFRELLTNELKSTKLFEIHEIIHGITAPGFLFGSGFAFAIVAQRRWNEVITINPHFFRRILRAINLIFIGYLLHIPYLSINKILMDTTPDKWKEFFLFDVLQCIGFTLLFMRLLLVIIKNEKYFIWLLTLTLLGIVYSTPYIWSEEFNSSLHPVLSFALSGSKGSYFPIFPYAGYLIAGTCISWLFLQYAQKEKEDIFIKYLLIAGVLLITIAMIIETLPFKLYPLETSFWYTSPGYFWLRLGVLFILMSGLWYLEDFLSSHTHSVAIMPKWIITLGIESLFVYIFHLLVLYGWVINPEFNIKIWASGQLNYLESTIVFAAFTLLMFLCAFSWRYLKKNHPVLMKGIYIWMFFSIIWSLLFSPY